MIQSSGVVTVVRKAQRQAIKNEAIEKWNERHIDNNGSCPFCGSNDFGFKITSGTIAIVCNKCFAHGPGAKNESEAKKKWEQIIQ